MSLKGLLPPRKGLHRPGPSGGRSGLIVSLLARRVPLTSQVWRRRRRASSMPTRALMRCSLRSGGRVALGKGPLRCRRAPTFPIRHKKQNPMDRQRAATRRRLPRSMLKRVARARLPSRCGPLAPVGNVHRIRTFLVAARLGGGSNAAPGQLPPPRLPSKDPVQHPSQHLSQLRHLRCRHQCHQRVHLDSNPRAGHDNRYHQCRIHKRTGAVRQGRGTLPDRRRQQRRRDKGNGRAWSRGCSGLLERRHRMPRVYLRG